MRQILILILTILSLVTIIYHVYKELKFQQFEINNKKFLIEKNKDIQQKNDALQNLVFIREQLDLLIAGLRKKYPADPKIIRMEERFHNTVIKEANYDKDDPKKSSYTINKGDLMVICLRTDDEVLVDRNTLMYVAIHELAHIYSTTLDTSSHGPEFWENMKYLLNEAIEMGIYKKVNYAQNPVKYCGIEIASNF